MNLSAEFPNLFIVGVPKSGTTSMHAYLAQHPEVFMSDLKEPYYFAEDFEISWRVRERAAYMGLFSGRKQEVYCGESSPLYMYSRKAAEMIFDFNPNARILVLFRNPVDMLYSLHGQFLYTNNEDIWSFEEALDAQAARMRSEKIPTSCTEPRFLQYLDIADYPPQLKRFTDRFGSERVKVILFDDLKNDPLKTYRDVLAFLGLDLNFEPDLQVFNRAKTLPNLRLRSFLQKIPFVKSLAGALLGEKRMNSMRDQVGKLTQEQRPGEVSIELRRKLNRHFSGMVKSLADQISRPLDHWLA